MTYNGRPYYDLWFLAKGLTQQELVTLRGYEASASTKCCWNEDDRGDAYYGQFIDPTKVIAYRRIAASPDVGLVEIEDRVYDIGD